MLQTEVGGQNNAEHYCQNLLAELYKNPECANDAAVIHHNKAYLRIIEEQIKDVES